ncbi:MAG: hypothetical protein QNJ32_01880 [Xenococcaceae cyanobacterium MO_167.B27]|nr:hypothetical protein [Xenococcaceae cyanobacterium MO_167.B27]
MSTKINFSALIFRVILSLMLTGCVVKSTRKQETQSPQNTDDGFSQPLAKPLNDSSCAVMKSRNWHAWIDRVAENESSLNIVGEVDLPNPGYTVEWKPGILDRRQPPAQRLSLLLTPPEGMVIQVVTPTKVNYVMPASSLEYRAILIYCGDQLLTEIPDVVPTE